MEYKKQRMTEYAAWNNMKNRCLNPNVKAYKDYGGRGIKVCDRWIQSFENFINDMGKKPSPSHSIDRIDYNGNYEPSNCRWLLRSMQNLNKRNNRVLTIDGITDTVTGHAKRVGINRVTVGTRLIRGWPISDVLLKPQKKGVLHNGRI
jgi:hypothetical protein